MEFTVHINCDNAAFEGDPVDEIARLLSVVTDKLRAWRYDGKLLDDNGNTVGEYELFDFEDEEDEEDEYDNGEIPDEVQEVIDQAEAGEDLEVLGVGQAANRVYDDGVWRVWIERVGPEDGYFGPRVTVEHWDGTCWSDFEREG